MSRLNLAVALVGLAAPLSLTLTAAGQSKHVSPPLQCLTAPAPPAHLPAKLPVGVETIHRDATKIITIYVALAPGGTSSRVLNGNSKDPNDRRSNLFVMSDGTVKTAFIGVDATPGSRLDLCTTEILKRLPTKNPEQVLTYLRDHLQNDYLREPPPQFVYPWDQGRKDAPEELVELFHAAKDAPVGQYPLRSTQAHDVVPLEKFLTEGYGTCMHNALLASLLLTKLGVPHRLVNGATRAIGHTWIQLADGRILDPSLKKLERPVDSQALPGWFKYGSTFAFEDQVWPFLALD